MARASSRSTTTGWLASAPHRKLTTQSAASTTGHSVVGAQSMVLASVASGSIKPNQTIKALRRDGELIETTRVTKVLAFRGLERTAIDVAEAAFDPSTVMIACVVS